MVIQDDRTADERETHTTLIVGTDSFMSGWGGAADGVSVAAWAVDGRDTQAVKAVQEWVERRGDLRRVRVVYDLPGNRLRLVRGRGHCHVYVVRADHPAVARLEAFRRETGQRAYPQVEG